MNDITNNEMRLVLNLFKNPSTDYNTTQIAKTLSLTPMGTLKIAKKLEKENLLTSKKLGKATYYRLDSKNPYTKQHIAFLAKREAEYAPSYIKTWIREIRKIKNAKAAILFGSLLKKQEKAEDIDVLLITNQNTFNNLKKEIEYLNKFNTKKIHPIYQTEKDFKNNLKLEDKVIRNALKGIIALGEDELIRMTL
ncbi:MAG TPA: nucleotidyltransferase domain-containing protein [Candidatus Nanoarchaeia archaeon]|nr:nucleotidyltransferase domain-containing protein [Candidatus Nanoarchaeia archaeon]